jgi:hypothetical protein
VFCDIPTGKNPKPHVYDLGAFRHLSQDYHLLVEAGRLFLDTSAVGDEERGATH